MIKTLNIKNFQIHKELKIDFDKHVTTIIGKTDGGKSAIVRALRWLCLNDFFGDSFIRCGASESVVELTVDDRKIIRKKGVHNAYTLDKQKFVSFNRNVPDPIKDLLGLTSDNFQSQLDSPFWFCLTPGELSRRLNEIVHLDLMDRTLTTIGARVRQVKERISFTEERQQDIQKELDSLSWVDSCSKDLERLENLEKEIENRDSKIASAQSFLDRLEGIRKTAKAALEVKQKGEKRRRLVEDVITRYQQIQSATETLEEMEECRKRVSVLEKRRSNIQTRLRKEMKGSCPLCGSETTLS